MKGRMNEGKNGRKDEEKEGSTTEVIENDPGKSKIDSRIDPKWSQNQP